MSSTYKMYVLGVSTSSRVPLANSNGVHLVAADRSVQCQTKSDGVRTTAVEKADEGTLDRCESLNSLHAEVI